MPFWLSVACFLNAGVWTLYGFLPFDPFMAVSFISLSFIKFCNYFAYKNLFNIYVKKETYRTMIK